MTLTVLIVDIFISGSHFGFFELARGSNKNAYYYFDVEDEVNELLKVIKSKI